MGEGHADPGKKAGNSEAVISTKLEEVREADD
jgi:hypothetical protein